MQCPQCLTYNPDSATYCTQCGSPVEGPARRSRSRLVGVVFAGVVVVLGFICIRMLVDTGASRERPGGPASEAPKSTTGWDRDAELDGPEVIGALVSPSTGRETLPAGWVRIEDAWGQPLGRYPAVVAEGSWIALPRRSCLGGARWLFRLEGQELPIVAGIWQSGEDVGLWLLDGGLETERPPLSPWSPEQPLSWLALEGGAGVPRGVGVSEVEDRGPFQFFIPEDLPRRRGVFVQDEGLVGWTFGGDLEGAWLWAGEPGSRLRHEVWVEDFYRRTFAGGREESFAEGLALVEGRPPIDGRRYRSGTLREQLSVFA